MLTNYLKVALRSITRNKLSSFINIVGLALAIACSLLIFLFIRDEVAYDQHHANADRIYRVTRDWTNPQGAVDLHLGHVAPPFGPLLKNDFGEFEEVARTLQTRFLVAYQEDGAEQKVFNEDNTFFAEPAIFKIFTIPVAKGNPEKSLADPFTVMLSTSTAKRYFGSEDAVGKTLRVGNQYNYTVSGVFEDFPDQSHWHPDLLVAFSTLNDSTIYGRQRLETNWGNNSFGTYILAKAPLDVQKLQVQFPAFIDRHLNGNGTFSPSSSTRLYLQKVTDIHLRSHLDSEIEQNGDITNVYMMGVIALFIVLIACFNFINLSTARATKRAKEVGLRKVVGAFKAQLIFQFLSESMLVALFALALATVFTYLALPWLNAFTNKDLMLNPLNNATLFLAIIVVTLLIGIAAGVYPAFVISGFRPALILKGQQGSAKGKGMLRRGLVVAQFSISIVLIIATLITQEQLQYLNDRELGYEKDKIIVLRYYGELAENFDAFYNEIVKTTHVEKLGRSNLIPTGRLLNSAGTAQIAKDDSLVNTDVVLKNVNVDHEFFETYGIPVVAGRNFSKDIVNDDSVSFILNEAALAALHMNADEVMQSDFQYGGIRGKVIGVVKDFHFESLHERITPIVFQAQPFFGRMSIRLTGNFQEGIEQVEKVWRSFLPHRPFEFNFLNDRYQQLYEAEQRQNQLFTVFSCMAILIACLGLFGLATFNTMQRVKEIGIRKVLGASVMNIVQLLSKEIVMLIVIANVIAWPVAWYFMEDWLNQFAYRIDLNVALYLLAALVAIAIGLITVSTQTIRAAKRNPANTLRYE